MLRKSSVLLFIVVGLFSTAADAGISVSPYVSITSTKKIKPEETGKEKSDTQQKTVYGVRARISFFRLLGIEISAGQGKTETETTVGKASDTWDEVDYEDDLEMSTNDPDKEVKTTETLRRARVGVTFDPGFWILIARAKVGAQASQREVELQESDEDPVTKTTPITYKPYAGAGLGVKFGPRMKVMAEYQWFFYKFPEYEPFEREVTVSFTVAMGRGGRR